MLPTEKTPPKDNLLDLTVLVYGPGKIGKSTWCSKADSALFLATEAGLNSLEVFQEPIASWDKLLDACRDVAEGRHAFKTIVVDTVDNAYRMCAEHVCKKAGVEHESDLEYGKGYALVNNEFQRVLTKLALLPYGLFLVSHSQEKDIETRTGKLTRIVPTLPEKARKIVLGMVDLILFCDVETTLGSDGQPVTRRVMRTKPSANYEAGDRTGRLPELMDLDFAQFAQAFARSPSGPPTPPSPPSASPPAANAPTAAPPPPRAATSTTTPPPGAQRVPPPASPAPAAARTRTSVGR